MKKPYTLKALKIHEMPGLPRGLEPLGRLAGGINVIHGPNASGKSSTARAIRRLVAGTPDRAVRAEGRFDMDGSETHVSLYAGGATYQKDGNERSENPIGPMGDAGRYMLAVHELLREEESDMAAEIARESIGGFDLDAAANTLGYDAKTTTSANNKTKNWEAAEKAVRATVQIQEKLLVRQRALNKLRAQAEKAEEARKRKTLIELALTLADKEAALEKQKLALSDFPEGMAQLEKSDHERLTNNRKEKKSNARKIREASEEIEKLRQKLKGLSYAAPDGARDLLNMLDAHIDQLDDATRGRAEKKRLLEQAKAQAKQALSALGPQTDATKLEALDVPSVQALGRFLQEALETLAKKTLADNEINKLKTGADQLNETAESETLSRAVSALGHWLTAAQTVEPPKRWPLIVVALLAAAVAVLTQYFGAHGFWGLVAVALGILWAWREAVPKVDRGEMEVRQRDFADTGLGGIASWNADTVARRITELNARLNEALRKKELGARLERTQSEQAILVEKLSELETQRTEWAERIGAAPALPDFAKEDYGAVYWFLHNATQWIGHQRSVRATEVELMELETQISEHMAACNALFGRLGFAAVDNAPEAKGRARTVAEEAADHNAYQNRIAENQRLIDNLKTASESLEKEAATILERLGPGAQDLPTIAAWTEKLPAYTETKDALKGARHSLAEARQNLESHPLYEVYREELSETDRHTLTNIRDAEAEKAAGLAAVRDEITGTEKEIELTEDGHALEDALAQRQRAEAELQTLFEDNLRSMTGHLLTEALKEDSRRRSQPEILRRAGEILARITGGRYSLLLGERGDTSFRAMDTKLGKGLALNELSSGTRVQLLLAVRLAYVETRETDFALPLLCDELLANSDETRAEAIIEALIDFAEAGRQVFYFTAQRDEVAKWEHYLAKRPDLDSRIISLVEADPLPPAAYRTGPSIALQTPTDVPRPEGLSHSEYGDLLGVPAFWPLAQPLGALHTWYIVTDTALLYECLRTGKDHWGGLSNFLKKGGHLSGLDDETKATWFGMGELLEKYGELLEIGRPKAIDRGVLEASGAITDNFIDRVDEKLRTLDGNPEKLLSALEAGEISRFHKDKTQELRVYLEREGYLDTRERLTSDELENQLDAYMSTTALDRGEAIRFINRLQERRGTPTNTEEELQLKTEKGATST